MALWNPNWESGSKKKKENSKVHLDTAPAPLTTKYSLHIVQDTKFPQSNISFICSCMRFFLQIIVASPSSLTCSPLFHQRLLRKEALRIIMAPLYKQSMIVWLCDICLSRLISDVLDQCPGFVWEGSVIKIIAVTNRTKPRSNLYSEHERNKERCKKIRNLGAFWASQKIPIFTWILPRMSVPRPKIELT